MCSRLFAACSDQGVFRRAGRCEGISTLCFRSRCLCRLSRLENEQITPSSLQSWQKCLYAPLLIKVNYDDQKVRNYDRNRKKYGVVIVRILENLKEKQNIAMYKSDRLTVSKRDCWLNWPWSLAQIFLRPPVFAHFSTPFLLSVCFNLSLLIE